MTEIIVRSPDLGGRKTGILNSATTVIDLSLFKGSYVRLWTDADTPFRFMFSRFATAGAQADGTTAAQVDMDVAAADKSPGTVRIPESCWTPQIGMHRFVDHQYPYLFVRGINGTIQLEYKQTSEPLIGV